MTATPDPSIGPRSAPALAPNPLLPGQAAAPPGPCDLTGMYLMHHALRRDLARLRGAVAVTPLEQRSTWQALRTWWGNVAALLEEHHTKEDDVLWPALEQRVDLDGRTVLQAMQAEHHLLDPLLETVSHELGRLAHDTDPTTDGSAETRTRATTALTDLEHILDQHLAHEERDAIALIQAHLDGAEWRRLERGGLAAKPNPRLLLFLLPWIADELPSPVLARVLTEAGLPMRVLLRLSRPRYRRLAARAFAHLPSAA